jgi:hypothetical protein
MEGLLLVGILILNVLISIWNCYAVGSAWKDTMAIGGWFNKLLLWCGIIQSGVGFSMPILIGLTWGAVAFLTSGEHPDLTPAEGQEMMQAVFSLWYIAVIFPILGSGLAIWAHSLREAYRRRNFSSFAVAGWNSYAQIHNTLSAINNLGGAFGNVGEFFGKAMNGKGDAKGKGAILVIMIVILSLVAGFMIAFALVRHFANKAESRIEEFGRTQFGRGASRA